MKRVKKRIYVGSTSILASLLAICCFMVSFSSCTSGDSKSQESAANIDSEDFYATQPVHSGLFDADYYDISGNNARKGRFDGRIYFTLSPETSALYVFENGNRTKINCLVSLEKPFEKGDSGIFYSADRNNNPVTINTDSLMYVLDFKKGNESYQITFNPKPRHQGSAVEILEKMNEQIKRK